jgi:hypothetical protein
LDAGAYGEEADFWVDVRAAYIDPRFPIGDILVDSPLFKDNDGVLFDLSKVNSPWVDHSKLKLWYETALRALQKFRVNHDKSGMHEFSTEEGYQEFAHNYAADSKDVCFLAGAARYRGDEALDFFSGELPDSVPVVKGLSRRRLNDEDTLASDVTGLSRRPRRKRSHDGVLDENQVILEALAKSNSPSKERDSYYHERTKQLKMVNKNGGEREKLKLARERAETTAKVAQSITQMYAAANQARENGASNAVVRSIRQRAEKLASSMARIGGTTTSSSEADSDVSESDE